MAPGRDPPGALRDRLALHLGEQREEHGHDPRLDVVHALDPDVLRGHHEGDAGPGEGVPDGHDLPPPPAEPRELADDEAVAGLEDARQLVEP